MLRLKTIFILLFVFNVTNWVFANANSTDFPDPVPFPQMYFKHPVFDKAMGYSNANDYVNAEIYWEIFTSKYPDVWQGYFYTASAQVRLQKQDAAYANFEIAHQMNPFDTQLLLDYIYASALINNRERALLLADKIGRVSYSSVISSNGQWFTEVIAYHGSTANEGVILSAAHAKMVSTFNEVRPNDMDYASIDTLMKFTGGQYLPIWNAVQSLNGKMKKRGLDGASYHFFLSRFLMDVQTINQAEWRVWLNTEIVKTFIKEYQNEVPTNDYYKAVLGMQQFNQFFGNADYDRAYILISKLIEDLAATGLFRHKLIEMYQAKAKLLYFMDRNTEFAAVAESLEQVTDAYENPLYKAKSYELICALNKDQNYEKAIEFGEKALAIAEKNELSIAHSLQSLLAITYFDNGNTEKGLEYAGANKEKMDYAEYYNVASMLHDNEKLDLALEYFLKSYNHFNETLSEANAKQKLTLRGKMNDLYSGLVECYYDMENKEEVFNVLEMTKAQALSNSMGAEKMDKITLKELQATLDPDEAFISYKITQQSVFLYIVVTHDKVEMNTYNMVGFINPIKKYFGDVLMKIDEELSNVEFKSPEYQLVDPAIDERKILVEEGDFELIIEYFRKHLTGELATYLPNYPASEVTKIGNMFAFDLWNNFLSAPQEQIGFKKKLYLCLDGALNFIPFEALKDGEGKYVAETQEIKIVPSASVLMLLKNRKYSNDRKAMLAMGGAIYKEPQSDVKQVASINEIYEWKLKSYDLVDNDQSLTDLFKALGYSKMNYLPGTLSEVLEIDSIFDDAMIITGEEMTEKRIKELSASGELKKYKVLHLATHGWVNNSMPSVSGMAMCIPDVSLDGEDGRLIAKEIRALDLNADLVMLSACQTGLGKLYGGEAVEGLNQSLFIAGANSTIVSLWPVNDYATSIMVTEMYKLVKDKQFSYSEALNQVKRNFIIGKYNTNTLDLSAPEYWAPFVYNGM